MNIFTFSFFLLLFRRHQNTWSFSWLWSYFAHRHLFAPFKALSWVYKGTYHSPFWPYHSHVHYIKTETSFCICAHLQTHNKPDLHTKSAQCEIITRLSDTLTIFILWRILCYVQFFFRLLSDFFLARGFFFATQTRI